MMVPFGGGVTRHEYRSQNMVNVFFFLKWKQYVGSCHEEKLRRRCRGNHTKRVSDMLICVVGLQTLDAKGFGV